MQSLPAQWTVSPSTANVGNTTYAAEQGVIGFVIVIYRPLIAMAWVDCKSI
jgi:hypothetical protein